MVVLTLLVVECGLVGRSAPISITRDRDHSSIFTIGLLDLLSVIVYIMLIITNNLTLLFNYFYELF